MELQQRVVPTFSFITGKGARHEEQITIDEHVVTYAPTLAGVHDRLFGDFGPFVLSWQNEWLCPFDERVGSMNVTCSGGLRKHCAGNGILITKRLINHLDHSVQELHLNKVICYEWCHRLSRAYWDIPIEELYSLPDDTDAAIHEILNRTYQITSWSDWRTELHKRTNSRCYRSHLQPIEPRA